MEITYIVLQIAALLFAVSFHESAHGWVAWKWGDTTAKDLGRISLNPLRHIDPVGSVLVPAVLAFTGAPVFGWAKPVPVSLAQVPLAQRRAANLFISAAGPASNLLFAAVAAVVALAIRPEAEPTSSLLFVFGFFLVQINVVLALFNLLPIPPLDGFGVVESLLPRSMYPAAAWLRRYGMIFLVLLLFSGALGWILSPPLNAVARQMLGR